MRLYPLLSVSHLTCMIAGGLLVIAFQQTSPTMCVGFAIAAIVLGILPAAFTILLLRKDIAGLSNLANPENRTQVADPRSAELLRVADQFRNTLRKVATTVAHSKNELQGIHDFLAEVDRRGFGVKEGDATSSIAQFRGMLTSYGEELNERVSQLLSCGLEIESSTDKLVVGSESQAEVVNRTVSLVDKMATQIDTVFQQGLSAVTSSTNARESAVSCLRDIQAITTDMTRMRDHVAAREKKLRVLGDHTNEIGSIVETIATISSRTDLLALNASIESVRAGEHGRGFAVVAEEVRSLAEQAAQAARDVAARIESVQIETQRSIAVAADEHSSMEQVIQRVNRVCDDLQQINELASESVGQTKQISLVSQQQLDLSGEVVSAMESFAEVTRQFRSQSEGARWTAKSLASLGSQLDGTLELFKRLSQSPTRTVASAVTQTATRQSTSASMENPSIAVHSNESMSGQTGSLSHIEATV